MIKTKRAGVKESVLNEIRGEAGRILDRHLGVLRNEEGLRICICDMERLNGFLEEREKDSQTLTMGTLKLKGLLTVGRLVAESALRRKESLGSHYRVDVPKPRESRVRGVPKAVDCD
jgi:L-aspartate oxidase